MSGIYSITNTLEDVYKEVAEGKREESKQNRLQNLVLDLKVLLQGWWQVLRKSIREEWNILMT